MRRVEGSIKDAFLAIKKEIIVKVDITNAILVLFGSFFIFNVNYPTGCTNLYILLESLLLNKPIQGRKPRLSALLAELISK